MPSDCSLIDFTVHSLAYEDGPFPSLSVFSPDGSYQVQIASNTIFKYHLSTDNSSLYFYPDFHLAYQETKFLTQPTDI